MTTEWRAEHRRVSGFENGVEPAETLGLQLDDTGQTYPKHYPHRATEAGLSAGASQTRDALGEPLSIHQVAKVLGCSAWTVRHGYLPQGLPHFRSGPMGKLVFFRNQIIQWILQQQKKGGR